MRTNSRETSAAETVMWVWKDTYPFRCRLKLKMASVGSKLNVRSRILVDTSRWQRVELSNYSDDVKCLCSEMSVNLLTC